MNGRPRETYNDSVVESLRAADLIRSWHQDFGIHVAHLFDGVAQIDMRIDTATGRIDFQPCVLGDAAFYQALRQFKWYHPTRKLEHVHAATLTQPGDLVLDIGAGNGDFSAYLSRVEYIGLEQDRAAVDAAIAHGRDLRHLSIGAWLASEPTRKADIVTAFQVLEHVSDPQAFLAALNRCLAPGGSIVIGVPDAESYVTRVPDLMLNAPPHHVTWWTEASLRANLAQAGLDVIDVKRFGVEPWEYQLWWMATFASWMSGPDRPHFGRRLRVRKVLAYCLSWPLQWLAPPRQAAGSTLLVQARRATD
ncbi:MAG: class I SAM-dependent methyltransferase [Pseudomonadota bacterium]